MSNEHYRRNVSIRITDEDIMRGHVDVQLDPYIIGMAYNVGGGPREQIMKKVLRGTSKGDPELKVIAEIRSALDRWETLVLQAPVSRRVE